MFRVGGERLGVSPYARLLPPHRRAPRLYAAHLGGIVREFVVAVRACGRRRPAPGPDRSGAPATERES